MIIAVAVSSRAAISITARTAAVTTIRTVTAIPIIIAAAAMTRIIPRMA